MQSSKSTLPDQKTNIEQFERYINALMRLYMVSLEANQTVRTEFDALLRSKDMTIQGLQEQLSAAKKFVEDSAKKAEVSEKETEELKVSFASQRSDYEAQITNMQSMLVDKDSLNKALSNSYNEENRKIVPYRRR